MHKLGNNPADNDRIRPGFVILLSAMVAAVLMPLWMLLCGPSLPDAPQPAAGARAATAPATAHTMRRVTSVGVGIPGALAPAEVPPAPPTPTEQQWGVQFLDVTVSSNGVVELQYKLVSAERAAAIDADGVAAYLLEPVSGVKTMLANPVPQGAAVPAHSRARSAALTMWHAGGSFPPPPSRAVTGRVYSILLPNSRMRSSAMASRHPKPSRSSSRPHNR